MLPTELVAVDAPLVTVVLAAVPAAAAFDAAVFFTIVTADFGVGIVEIELEAEAEPEDFVAGTVIFLFPGK